MRRFGWLGMAARLVAATLAMAAAGAAPVRAATEAAAPSTDPDAALLALVAVTLGCLGALSRPPAHRRR